MFSHGHHRRVVEQWPAAGGDDLGGGHAAIFCDGEADADDAFLAAAIASVDIPARAAPSPWPKVSR